MPAGFGGDAQAESATGVPCERRGCPVRRGSRGFWGRGDRSAWKTRDVLGGVTLAGVGRELPRWPRSSPRTSRWSRSTCSHRSWSPPGPASWAGKVGFDPSACTWVFSSKLNTMALSGGFGCKPTTSTSFFDVGSAETLNVSGSTKARDRACARIKTTASLPIHNGRHGRGRPMSRPSWGPAHRLHPPPPLGSPGSPQKPSGPGPLDASPAVDPLPIETAPPGPHRVRRHLHPPCRLVDRRPIGGQQKRLHLNHHPIGGDDERAIRSSDSRCSAVTPAAGPTTQTPCCQPGRFG